jgi:hypothetical protein
MRNYRPERDGPKLVYVDRPEITETFADGLETVVFDGMSVRMEFVVNRLDPANSHVAATGRKVTAARLVLPIAGVMNLASQLNALLAALGEQGALNEVTLVQSHKGMN